MKTIRIPTTVLRSIKYIFIVFFAVFFIYNSSEISESIVSSLTLCYKIIIPSLFPMLILSSVLLSSELPQSITTRLHKYTNFTFGLSGNCLTAIISGLLFGYNAAYLGAETLYKENKIELFEAQRIALFFTNPGISFCIIITGITHYSCAKLGIMLLVSNILSSIILACICNIFSRKKTVMTCHNSEKTFSESLIKSVKSTTDSLITISSWIILFNCILKLPEKYLSGNVIWQFISILAEVTHGIDYCSDNLSLFAASLCLSFGGICIFLQQMPIMHTLRIKPSKALFVRVISAFLSTFILNILLLMFPVNTNVFIQNNGKIQFFNSPVGTISLVMLAVIHIVLTLQDKKEYSS